MLYDLKLGIQCLDSMYGVEYAAQQHALYKKTNNEPLGSLGMLVGFVSYTALVDKETLKQDH